MDLLQLNEFDLLFIVVAALYLCECACWLPKGTYCVSRTLQGYRPIKALVPLTFAGRSLAIGNPSPTSVSFLCSAVPLALDPQGVAADPFLEDGHESSSGPKHLRFDETQSVAWRGRELWLNGEKFLTLTTDQQARRVARLIRRLRGIPSDRRTTAILAFMHEAIRPDRVLARLTDFNIQTRWLAIACSTFCGLAFVVGPIFYYLSVARRADHTLVWPYLACLACCWGWVALLALGAHRRMNSEATVARVQHGFLMLLSPAAAMRARDAVARHLLANFHPLAVIAAVCGQKRLKAEGQITLRELYFPTPTRRPARDPDAVACMQWYRARMIDSLETMLRDQGIDTNTILVAPDPLPDAVAFCPRCHCQFVTTTSKCHACDGIATQAFPLVEKSPVNLI